MGLSGTAFTIGSLNVSWLALEILAGVLFLLYIWVGLMREREPRVHLGLAFSRAFSAGEKRIGNLLKFLLVEVCFRLMGLAPLLFLLAPGYRYLAALALPVWLLVVNPARVNAAAAMQDCLAGGSIFSYRLADGSRWGAQVISGVKRMGFLLLWLLPLAGTGLYIWNYWLDIGKVDAITWINMMKDAGNDDFMTGVINTALPMVVMLGASLVILVIGIAFHSGARHALALGNKALANGHHGKLVLGWICSLILMTPLWIAVVILVLRFISMAGGKSDMTELMNQVKGLKSFILLTLGGGVLLTLPLLPFRSLMIADMVRQMKDRES